MKKKWNILLCAALAALLLCGCAPQTVEDMYALPKRSEEYNQLQSAIDIAMVGLTYSAPLSGENRQSVQMADLDGDGVDEYLVFAQGTSEKPLHVLIFCQEADGSCLLAEVITSTGSAFEQVEYVQIDDLPGYELVIGRQVSDQVLRSVSVYSFAGGDANQLMKVGYSRYFTCDLDLDGQKELMVLQPDEMDTDRGKAMLFRYTEGVMERSVEAILSEEPSQVKRISQSSLHPGYPAIYITSSVDESTIITDVLAMKDGRLTNISVSNETDTSVQTLRNYYVYADDIDGDGILELPSLVTMKAVSPWEDNEEKFLIRWYAMDLDGEEVDKAYTFHNFVGGWYLQLHYDWARRVSVEQDGGTYTFYVWDDFYQSATALFSVYVLTGSDRNAVATEDGRFVLLQTEDAVFAARTEANAALFGISKDQLIDSFSLIQEDVQAGES